ncbi:hypothetical protein [Pseudomonas eucalypticola]|uniref:hypothetical protein n=1 Tax=Pseudomonas eucalypticola TaxID=2599595 RepID=UPI001FD86FC9|nr:hypothetical protein [Pseudomonas eucalypticola]
MPSKQLERLMVSEIDRIDAIFNDPTTYQRNRIDYPEIEFPGLAVVVSRTVALRREVLAWLVAKTLRNISYFDDADKGKATVVIANHNPAVLVRQLLALLGRLDFSTVDQVVISDDDWPKLTSAVNLLDGHEGSAEDLVDGEPPFSPDPEARLKWRNGAIGLAELKEIITAQLPGSSVVVENYHLIMDVANSADALRDLRNTAAEAGVYLYIGGGMTHWHEVREKRSVYLSDLAESLAEAANIADLITIVYPGSGENQVCVFDPRYTAPYREAFSLPDL